MCALLVVTWLPSVRDPDVTLTRAGWITLLTIIYPNGVTSIDTPPYIISIVNPLVPLVNHIMDLSETMNSDNTNT